MTTRLTVHAASGAYDVVIGVGALSLHPAGWPDMQGRRVLVVADQNVMEHHVSPVVAVLETSGATVQTVALVATEQDKRMSAVESIWDAALRAGLDRHSLMVAIGGGLTGDVVGFAAATYLRGIDVVQVPTTLLAMADASVGGKTGINVPLPERSTLGKNLAGAFWPPRLVLIDPMTLATLPRRDVACGLAECIKHGILADRSLLEVIRASTPLLLEADPEAVERVVTKAVAVKINVVDRDERETGERMLLNLGHTFAHAIEPLSELDLRHGEAVSVGLMAAYHCSVELGLVAQSEAASIASLLETVTLPIALSKPVSIDALIDAMRFDKKATAGVLRLILPTEASAVVRDDIPEGLVRSAWESVMPAMG